MYGFLRQRSDVLASVAPVIVRVIVGGMMFVHGLDKVTGDPSGFGQFLASKGLPFGLGLAWLVALLELLGGAMLVVGLLARPVALLLSVELVGAIVLVTWERGLIGTDGVGYERDLAYIAGFLVVLLLGPGRPSIDHAIGLERSRAAAPVGG